jgi:hypothetical protein
MRGGRRICQLPLEDGDEFPYARAMINARGCPVVPY